MDILKVGKFDSILDGVEARLGGRPAPDVMTVDWQAVSPTRHIVVLKGISPDRDVHIRLEATMGGAGNLRWRFTIREFQRIPLRGSASTSGELTSRT